MFKSAIEWSKYLNLSKVHAFLPGIKFSLHPTVVEGKIINMWSTSATILDPEVSLQLSNSVSSSKYKVLFPLSKSFTSLDKVCSSGILKHYSHTGLPYFAYAFSAKMLDLSTHQGMLFFFHVYSVMKQSPTVRRTRATTVTTESD